jgi:hypothetical protein
VSLLPFFIMPPNVDLWDASSATNGRFRQLQRTRNGCAEDDVETFISSDLKQRVPVSAKRENDKANRWHEWLLRKETLSTGNIYDDHLVIDAFSSILIMDEKVGNKKWLHRFGGRLSSISKDLLVALR